MDELIIVKNDDIFTTSLIIADRTHNEHRSVRRLIEKYKNDLEDFGKVCISNAPLINSLCSGQKQFE